MSEYEQKKVKISKILLFIVLALFPLYSQVIISGTITTENGEILPGANIVFNGTSLGTVSDKEGQFTLDIPESNYIKSDGELVVTYIGYITKKIIIQKERQFYKIVLVKDALDLTQVLVTGRGVCGFVFK